MDTTEMLSLNLVLITLVVALGGFVYGVDSGTFPLNLMGDHQWPLTVTRDYRNNLGP